MRDALNSTGRVVVAMFRATVWYLVLAAPAVVTATWALHFADSGLGAVAVLAAMFPFLYLAMNRATNAYQEATAYDDEDEGTD